MENKETIEIKKPRELSKDLIHSMRRENEASTKFFGIFQVINIREDRAFITLSDGYSYSEVALFKSIRTKIDSSDTKVHDIVYGTLILHKGSIEVLMNFDRIYSNVNKLIGEPIPYSQYRERDLINPNGDNSIPRQFWDEKKASAAPQNSISQTGPSPAMIKDLDDDDVHKLSTLTSGQLEFIIKVRVRSKTNLRQFDQGKAKSSLFNIVIADETQEIQGTFFSTAADKFFDLIQEGSTYLIIGGEVRRGGKYNSTANSLEIYFNTKTEIVKCPDTMGEVKPYYNFKKIGDIKKLQNFTAVDLVGVVETVEEGGNITMKTGEAKRKQTFKIVDDSNHVIGVTVWGNIPGVEKLQKDDVVIFTGLTVGEFNKTKGLNTKPQSKVIPNPGEDHHEAVKTLTQWLASRDESGVRTVKNETKLPDNYYITLSQLKRDTEFLDKSSPLKQVFTVSGYPTIFGNTFTYNKCPLAECFKKAELFQNDQGGASSECQTHGHLPQPPVPRFIGNVRITDHTENCYMNYTSDQVGQILFGLDAQAMVRLAEDKEALGALLEKRSNMKFTFKVGIKFDSYQGTEKMKYSIFNCYDQEGNRLKYENLGLINTIQKIRDNLF